MTYNGLFASPPGKGRIRPQTAHHLPGSGGGGGTRMHGTIVNLGSGPAARSKSPNAFKRSMNDSSGGGAGGSNSGSRADLTKTLHTIKAQIEKEKARLSAPNWKLPPANNGVGGFNKNGTSSRPRPQTAGLLRTTSNNKRETIEHFYDHQTGTRIDRGLNTRIRGTTPPPVMLNQKKRKNIGTRTCCVL